MDLKNDQKCKKILLVDDSFLSSKITSNFLCKNGYVTESVVTGEEAIQKATSSPSPNLILMDIGLAGEINGIDAAREILKCVNIPIVFYTANTSMDVINKIKELNVYGYVLKSHEKIALLSTVKMALKLYEANKEIENSKKQYFELAEYAPIGIVKCDNDGNIIYANDRTSEILGSPNIEETKKINLLTFPNLFNYGISKKLEECLQNNTPGVYEMKYKSIWGKNLYIRFHIRPLTDACEVVNGAQIIIDDITEKKHLEEVLQTLALTDPLTNTYNRRFLNQKLEEEIARIQRQGNGTFSLAMLDIDDFKSKNDCYGHNYGDIVLKKITEIIKDRIRKTDCLARWGGEEFVIFIQGTQLHQSLILIEELRKSISDIEFYNGDKVTATFGVAEYCPDDTINSLIQKVDDLMYKGKASGKNRVCYE